MRGGVTGPLLVVEGCGERITTIRCYTKDPSPSLRSSIPFVCSPVPSSLCLTTHSIYSRSDPVSPRPSPLRSFLRASRGETGPAARRDRGTERRREKGEHKTQDPKDSCKYSKIKRCKDRE